MFVETIPNIKPDEERRLQRVKNQAAIDLINELLAEEDDEYGEELWNRLKETLENTHTPRRRLFYDE